MTVDRLLTVEQAAQVLGVGRTSTYQLIASGELPSVVVGRRSRRVRQSDLDTYIASLEPQPASG